MAILAFICESKEKKFDIIHCGEDPDFLPDGRVFLGMYFALEVPTSSKNFKTIKIAIHGKIQELEKSKFVRTEILCDPDIPKNAIKEKIIIYNHTFEDSEHPSNEGFEGFDYKVEGRECSFDGYSNVYFPRFDEISISTTERKNSEINLITIEYPFKSGKRYIFRLGFVLDPPAGRRPRFWIIPPTERYKIHFYTTRDLLMEDVKYLEKTKPQIADVRLNSPFKKEIRTCDFFYQVGSKESVPGLCGELHKRLPFAKEGTEFSEERLAYHKYAQDLHQIKPIRKRISGGQTTEILKFGRCEPCELIIERSPIGLFYALFPTFLALFGFSMSVLQIRWYFSLIFAGFLTYIVTEILRRGSVAYHK